MPVQTTVKFNRQCALTRFYNIGCMSEVPAEGGKHPLKPFCSINAHKVACIFVYIYLTKIYLLECSYVIEGDNLAVHFITHQ